MADTADARATGRLSRVVVHRANQKAFDQLIKVEQGGSASLGGRLGAERRHGGLNPRTFDLLLRTGQLSGARAMTLGGVLLGDDQLRALIDTADLSDLRELWLSGWALTRAGVVALANGPALARLTELNLDATPLGAATGAVRELAANSGLRNVETLRLIDCAIGDGDARTLAKSPCFPKLKRLELSQNHDLTAAGVAALLASKHFPHLARLDWDDTRLPDRAFLPLLLAAPDRPELAFRVRDVMMRRRILKNERIVEIETPRGEFENAFDDMTSAKGGERVTQLVARSLDLGATEMADLAAGFEPETLWSLNLTDNPLRNDGAAALTTAFATFGLRVLVLAGCRIQSAGVAALVGSDLFGGLHTLDLSRNNLGKAGVAALLKADVPAALKRLVLTYCRLTGDDEKQLKAKYGSRVSL